jgi:hypothetical protein
MLLLHRRRCCCCCCCGLQLMNKKHAWMGVRELQEKAKAAAEEAKLAQQAFATAQAEANHDERPLKCVAEPLLLATHVLCVLRCCIIHLVL